MRNKQEALGRPHNNHRTGLWQESSREISTASSTNIGTGTCYWSESLDKYSQYDVKCPGVKYMAS